MHEELPLDGGGIILGLKAGRLAAGCDGVADAGLVASADAIALAF